MGWGGGLVEKQDRSVHFTLFVLSPLSSARGIDIGGNKVGPENF